MSAVLTGPGVNYGDILSTPYGLKGELPPEQALKEQALNRRQQIANLLIQRGTQLPEGRMVGKFYVPPSWAESLANLGQIAAGTFSTYQNDKERQGISDESQNMLADAVAKYKQGTAPTTSELPGPGAPVQTATPGQGFTPEELAQPAGGRSSLKEATDALYAQRSPAYFQEGPRPTAQTPATPEARQQALVDLLASQHPQAQALGKLLSQQQAMQEERANQREFQQSEGALNREARLQGQEVQLNQAMMLGLITKEQKDQMLDLQKRQIDQTGELKKLELKNKQEALQQGKTPPGYRQSAEGNLEAIPGGPADLKQQGAFNTDTSILQSSQASLDNLAQAANELLKHPGLDGITGIRGAIPNIPGSDAADAAAKLATLKSKVFLSTMQEMKNNSRNGSSGLGQASDAEGKRLETSQASLENAQSAKQMRESLQKIVENADQAKGRLRDAYNLKHKTGEPASAAPSQSVAPAGPAKIASDAEFNALPSGTVFIGPDGKQRKKP